MWRRNEHPEGRQLAAACEAFLAGHYAEYLLGHDRDVPVWVWTNLLVHSTEDDLRAARAAGDGRAPATARLW